MTATSAAASKDSLPITRCRLGRAIPGLGLSPDTTEGQGGGLG
jgi:hypothetical protein